ncbi:MAG: Ig-like domain-containing protein [Spirochaetales bacterium]|nr:Ig-like domain-containing protein [Spirochaetales bacterium]
MTAEESVNVTGSSVLTLSNGGKAVYSSGSGTATLTYIYTVGSSDTNGALSVAAGAKPTFVTDAAGNELTSSQSAIILKDSSSNTFTVDTVCNAPTMSGITAGEVYKTAPTVTVSGTETGASLRYSADGGATNTTFTGTSFTPALSGDGTYQITVQQTDIAGNTSVWRSPIQIIFDAVAPTIKSISTTKASGTYGISEKLEITAEFSEAVSGSITVKLNTNATVTLSPSSATTASATYTVASGQNANTLQVSTVTGTVTDAAGNSSTTSHSGYTNFSGKTIRIDTTAPALSTYKVYKYGGTQTSSVSKTTLTQDVDSTKPITLTFDENVIKGSGTISIERVYKSYPAVLSADDWQSISDAEVKGLYIQRCIGTVGNDDVTPDTNAKYVLKYEIDHKAWDTTPSGDAGKVYNYFADKDYNVMTLDITSGLISVSGQNVTVTPSSALAVGITYRVVVSAGALIDTAGNLCAADSSVKFETGPTAVPVIRIDKKSGKESGSQPQSVGVKISTETFGGTIYYQSKYKETASNTEVITVSDVTNPTPANTSSTDQYTASLSNTATSAAIFKLYAYTGKSGLSQGTTAKELAFKTIVYNDSAYGFRGSDSTGGVSATTEFPLSWYGTPTSAQCDSNRLYSWHILKNFQFKTMSGENTYQNDGDANSLGYVGCLNKANVSHGGGGGGSSVTLKCTYDTGVGKAIYFVGTFDESNNWSNFIKGTWTSGNVWTVTVTSTSGSFEWKVIKADDGNPSSNQQWQSGGNNSYPSTTSITPSF